MATAGDPDAVRPSPLQRRRREATRLEIAEAAVTLFMEQGFDATTVDQIAKVAGVSLRTFYRYCDSKDDVLTAVFVTGRNRFVEVIAEICDIVTGPVSAEAVADDAATLERQGRILAKARTFPRAPGHQPRRRKQSPAAFRQVRKIFRMSATR